jgi:hypothetical protein
VRIWCGAGANQRRDEIQYLRGEARRLAELLGNAIEKLDNAGRHADAKALQKRLGIPLPLPKNAGSQAVGRLDSGETPLLLDQWCRCEVKASTSRDELPSVTSIRCDATIRKCCGCIRANRGD